MVFKMSKKAMTLSEIQEKADSLIAKFNKLIDENIPQKGDSSDECQQQNIRQALNELESTFDGLNKSDLNPCEDWESVNREAGFKGLK